MCIYSFKCVSCPIIPIGATLLSNFFQAIGCVLTTFYCNCRGVIITIFAAIVSLGLGISMTIIFSNDLEAEDSRNIFRIEVIFLVAIGWVVLFLFAAIHKCCPCNNS